MENCGLKTKVMSHMLRKRGHAELKVGSHRISLALHMNQAKFIPHQESFIFAGVPSDHEKVFMLSKLFSPIQKLSKCKPMIQLYSKNEV